MSRSFKKNPVVKGTNKFSQFCQQQSNKRVRRTFDISNGSCYKRTYPAYNICEYRRFEHLADCDSTTWRKIISK